MPRSHDTEHFFHFYRAQFRSELPLAIFPEQADYGSFLLKILKLAARDRLQVSNRHWSVGNLEIQQVGGREYLYGRIGKHSHKSGETYEEATLAFEPLESEELHSVSFVFEPQHEFMAIESSAYVRAETARSNLIKLFNGVKSVEREHFKLSLPIVEDYESALSKLKSLKSLSKFVAELRRPNPDVEDAWEEFYANIHTGSGADREKITWDSDTGSLNPDLSTPVGKAIQMTSAAYGKWTAVGRNFKGKPVILKSGNNGVTHKIDVSSVRDILDSAAHYFVQLFERSSKRKE